MSADGDEQLVAMLTACQDRLFAYILTLVPNRDVAHDILQETNIVLWRRRQEFELNTSFNAWAYKISHFQVLAHWRDRGRDRHRFSDDLLMQLASESMADAERLEVRREALTHCLEKLPTDNRALIELRYTEGMSVKRIAQEADTSTGAMRTTIYRIRATLRACIFAKLSGGTA